MEPRQAEQPEAPVVFRPGKKRKIYRQRSESSELTTPDRYAEKPHVAPDHVPVGTYDNDNDGDGYGDGDDERAVAEALRLRNARKTKLRGVEFRSEQAYKDAAEDGNYNAQNALVASGSSDAQPAEILVGGISRRFAPQTGLVGELVNKHMEEYIESELARRYSATTPVHEPPANARGGIAARAESGLHIRDQPTMKGKLQEIDLGEEVRTQNIAMTDRARRRLQGENVDDAVSPGPGRPRIGRDGKPWRPRKRRGSDDIKRDQLVEEFLRENRLDVYDVSSEQPQTAPAGDEAADERIAEEFRREFMDAMSQRRQRRRPAQPSGRNAKKDEEPILKGPKLGGSRNVRAAMRDILLKKELEKKR